MASDLSQWCDWHEDKRVYWGQSTDKGEIVNIYVDEWRSDCRHYERTGQFISNESLSGIETQLRFKDIQRAVLRRQANEFSGKLLGCQVI